MPSEFDDYRDGAVLYGDSFTGAEIEAWYKDEKEGYFNLGQYYHPGPGSCQGRYEYYAWNWRHAFRFLPANGTFEQVLGFGSAFGEELDPIKDRAKRITILDPSDGFVNDKYEYVKPHPTGKMPFPDATFDLVTCFGVLHHIPNVSFVLKEVSRCMKPGAWLLLRDPTESMGNWETARPGLTRHERGIPLAILSAKVQDAGLNIVHSSRCMFTGMAKIRSLITGRGGVYDRRWMVVLDDFMSNLPFWTKSYHPTTIYQKFRPLALYLVARKPAASGEE